MIKSSRTITKGSAVFLATVLLAGTIALSAPSFMIGTAQAQPYYGGGMDNRYNSYGSDYGSDYGNDNSYGSDYGSDYGMDNDRKSYDKRSYGNDYGYESQYQSYKPDYKPQYPPDKKDDRDKSKDKSVDIKKVKCNNININLNDGQGGTGNGDNGNQTNGNGNKTDGFKKINRDGFTFICINNNNNEAGGGNVTEPEPEPVEGCEECFENLTVDLKVILNRALAEGFEIGPLNVTAGSSIADLCDELESVAPLEISILDVIGFIFREGITNDEDILSFLNLLICLQGLDLIDVDIFSLRAALIQQGLITP